uniref:Immunoglobulin V-set domain-containing protein n=1 Tax=Myripristis murdjan TaxID=586833 RepID=A0A667XLN7_9TELE
MRRYLLQDTAQGIFFVTISNLTKEDSGKYWCAVSTKLSIGNLFDEVSLTVVDDKTLATMFISAC